MAERQSQWMEGGRALELGIPKNQMYNKFMCQSVRAIDYVVSCDESGYTKFLFSYLTRDVAHPSSDPAQD